MYGVARGFQQSENFSSLWMQVLNTYNVYFSALYSVIMITCIVYKLKTYWLEDFMIVLIPLCFGIWFLTEWSRLWFGYYGNLHEKVPQLCAFLLLTFFPQIPCTVFLAFLQSRHMPVEKPLNYVMLAFEFVEIGISYCAVKVFIQKQTASFFRLCQEQRTQGDGLDGDDGKPALTFKLPPQTPKTPARGGNPFFGRRPRTESHGSAASGGRTSAKEKLV